MFLDLPDQDIAQKVSCNHLSKYSPVPMQFSFVKISHVLSSMVVSNIYKLELNKMRKILDLKNILAHMLQFFPAPYPGYPLSRTTFSDILQAYCFAQDTFGTVLLDFIS